MPTTGYLGMADLTTYPGFFALLYYRVILKSNAGVAKRLRRPSRERLRESVQGFESLTRRYRFSLEPLQFSQRYIENFYRTDRISKKEFTVWNT